MKTVSALALFVVAAVLALGLPSSSLAVNYNPATTVVVYVHGFDMDGWDRVGVYGDDETSGGVLDAVNQIAALAGQPTWQTNPTAPNQVAGCTYYGDTAPAWYTPADIAEDAATPTCVPRYALRVAKYVQHVLNRAPSATGVTLLAGSFGGEITRYLIEHDLLGLASTQKICRWIPVVGVIRGNWAASNAPDWLAEIFGADSPDIDDMQYDWVNSHISANTTMNTALFAPMIITQYCATHDPDGYITTLTNDPNDAVNMYTDEFFASYSTSAALHQATDGTLQMPGKAMLPTQHSDIADDPGLWAGAVSAATNNKRVTTVMTRIKALTNGDWWGGNGEYVFNFQVTSPRAATLYGCTSPITNMRYNDGVSPLIEVKKGETKYPNLAFVDQIVPPGETQLNAVLECYELDNHVTYYDMWEIGSTSNMGSFTFTINASSNGVVTLSNSKMQFDFTTTIRNVY